MPDVPLFHTNYIQTYGEYGGFSGFLPKECPLRYQSWTPIYEIHWQDHIKYERVKQRSNLFATFDCAAL